MKLNEPRQSEVSRWNIRSRVLKSKSYLDYLKNSDYNNSYKQYCIKQFINITRNDERLKKDNIIE